MKFLPRKINKIYQIIVSKCEKSMTKPKKYKENSSKSSHGIEPKHL